MKKRIAVLLLLSLLSASAMGADAVEGKSVKRGPFSFVLPKPWHIPWQPEEKRKRNEVEVVITKDGVMLDRIELRARPFASAFDHTKKLLRPEMQPFEAALVVIDDLELNTSMKNFAVRENRPATVCGKPGFRIVFSYTDNGTLQYKAVYYGFQGGGTLYSIRFDAPAIHYFDAYLPAFEKIFKTVTITARDDRSSEKE